MFFKNLTLFRFSAAVADTLDTMEQGLDSQRLRACGAMEMGTRGFVSPYGHENGALTHTSGHHTLMTVASEDKLLPESVVNEELARKVRALTEEEDRRIGARERKRLKAELIDQLLPRAFVRTTRVPMYLDRKHGWLVIDTASLKSAENSLSTLREALGSFPAVPMATDFSPRQSMTHWLSTGELPFGLELGDECELRDPASPTRKWSGRNVDLESDEVHEHLRSGKQVFQLGLVFDDRIAFVLGEDLTLRKLRFLDVVTDQLDYAESIEQEMDARFSLMTLELDRLLGKLAEWFGLRQPADA